MPKTSSSELAVDPDDPAKLVAALEQSAIGCAWLESQWEALRERLQGRNELKYRVALDRSIATYDMVHGKDQREKEDDRVRTTPVRSPMSDFRSGGKRGGNGTHAVATSIAMGTVDAGGSTPEVDIQWAMEIDTADVLACGGYLPERCQVRDGGGRVSEGGGRRAEERAGKVMLRTTNLWTRRYWWLAGMG